VPARYGGEVQLVHRSATNAGSLTLVSSASGGAAAAAGVLTVVRCGEDLGHGRLAITYVTVDEVVRGPSGRCARSFVSDVCGWCVSPRPARIWGGGQVLGQVVDVREAEDVPFMDDSTYMQDFTAQPGKVRAVGGLVQAGSLVAAGSRPLAETRASSSR